MDGTTVHRDAIRHQRALGELYVSVKRRGAASVLAGLRQSGCLKARFPRPGDETWFDVATLNTSGGVAGGDVLDAAFHVGDNAQVTIASQAAERFYRTLPDSPGARVTTRIAIGTSSAAEWLPQETILFDRCSVRRALRVELAANSRFLGVESLVFGRAAMGEIVECASLVDLIEVVQDGRLLLHDAIRLDGEVATKLARPAIANGARAVATLIYVAPDAGDMLEPLRALRVAASAWDGMLVARIVTTDGAAMRAAILQALLVLRCGRAMPRVWMC